MSDLNWISGQKEICQQAISDVRSDKSDTDWMFIKYADKKGPNAQKLTFGDKGSSGVDQLKEHLSDDDIIFGLVRVSDKIDESVTIKFVFINWLGNKVSIMQKARLSVHLGPVKEFFGQTHLDFSCNTQDELSHSIIMERVMGASGSGSKVLDASGRAGVKSQADQQRTGATVKTGGRQSAEALNASDEVKRAIQEVRKDDSSKTWVLIGYQGDSSNLEVIGSGNGDVDSEVRPHLKDDSVAYGLIRKVETIDNTEAIKFCYLRWIGHDLPRMFKAKLGTHAGDAYQLLAPSHTSLDSPDLAEVTDENILRLIKNASGTAVHVRDTVHQPSEPHRPSHQASQPLGNSQPRAKPAASSQPRQQQQARPQETSINFQDEDAIRAAIKSVRSDSNDIDWALVTYTAPQSKTLKLEGTGSGGLEEMKSHMREDNIMYGLYRSTELIDASTTVKFTFVDWRGPEIHRMQRAALGTHSGAVRQLFEPFHVDLMAAREDEVTEDLINQKIKNASGTAHHVLN